MENRILSFEDGADYAHMHTYAKLCQGDPVAYARLLIGTQLTPWEIKEHVKSLMPYLSYEALSLLKESLCELLPSDLFDDIVPNPVIVNVKKDRQHSLTLYKTDECETKQLPNGTIISTMKIPQNAMSGEVFFNPFHLGKWMPHGRQEDKMPEWVSNLQHIKFETEKVKFNPSEFKDALLDTAFIKLFSTGHQNKKGTKITKHGAALYDFMCKYKMVNRNRSTLKDVINEINDHIVSDENYIGYNDCKNFDDAEFSKDKPDFSQKVNGRIDSEDFEYRKQLIKDIEDKLLSLNKK